MSIRFSDDKTTRLWAKVGSVDEARRCLNHRVSKSMFSPQLVVRCIFNKLFQACLVVLAAMSDTHASFNRFNSAASIAASQLCSPRAFKIAIPLDALSINFDHHRSRHVPMTRQLTPTQGLSRSPIRAAFQKNPRNPVFSARSFGKLSFRYVHVQRKSKTTVRKD
jgi:hypothetical protein